MENASFIEILWTIITLVCLATSSIGWGEARGDLRAVKQMGKGGPYLIVARAHVRHEIVRVVTQVVFVGVGVWAMFTPTTIRPTVTLYNLIASIAFVIVAVLLAFSSLRDRLDRRDLWDYFERQERLANSVVEHKAKKQR